MIYMHGGFEKEAPNVPTNTIMKFDLMSVLQTNQTLTAKLQAFIGKRNQASASAANNNNQSASSS